MKEYLITLKVSLTDEAIEEAKVGLENPTNEKDFDNACYEMLRDQFLYMMNEADDNYINVDYADGVGCFEEIY